MIDPSTDRYNFYTINLIFNNHHLLFLIILGLLITFIEKRYTLVLTIIECLFFFLLEEFIDWWKIACILGWAEGETLE